MSIRLTASVGSLDGLIANLHRADAAMQAATRRIVLRHGDRLKELTEKYCPYDASHPPEDFHLRDAIRLRFSDDALVARVGFLTSDFTKAGQPPYYKFVWHGTRFQAANPFPDRAQAEEYPRFKAELAAETKKAARRQRRAR